MVVIILRKVGQLGNFVLGDKGLGTAKVPFWLPSVFCCGISLPSNQEGVMTGPSPMSEDRFDFVLLFAIN